jgi:hypothetical protein
MVLFFNGRMEWKGSAAWNMLRRTVYEPDGLDCGHLGSAVIGLFVRRFA